MTKAHRTTWFRALEKQRGGNCHLLALLWRLITGR
jgi:hypothetical protein